MMHIARAKLLEKDSLVGALALLSVGLMLVTYVLLSSASETKLRATSTLNDNPDHPRLHLKGQNEEQYNAIALDIIQTLNCHKLLNTTVSKFSEGMDEGDVSRRRLDDLPGPEDDADSVFDEDEDEADAAGETLEEGMGRIGESDDGDMEGGEEGRGPATDDMVNFEGADDWKDPTAKHLFCMAAFSSNDERETKEWKEAIKCDATKSAQQPILELWSMARGEFEEELLLKVLDLAVESERTVAGKDLNLWFPRDDKGLEYMIAHVNAEDKTVDQGGIYGLHKNLGKGKTFIDVGSCLGTTSMAISILYPGTRILSIEVASPNWLLQELNFRCNAETFPLSNRPTIMLAGVGPEHSASMFARYTWQPDHVTTARAWTPKNELKSSDETLNVKLRPWHSILAEAEIPHHKQMTSKAPIDVLNVDCGACEYNLIPSMTDDEFNSIATVMGGVHWGYIPHDKLPSSKRGKETHQRLCKHENFATTAKECCEFPDMEVISSYPGQVLVKEEPDAHTGVGKTGTVADVAGNLCDDYDSWAREKHIYDIEDDFGWFQLTPSAKGE